MVGDLVAHMEDEIREEAELLARYHSEIQENATKLLSSISNNKIIITGNGTSYNASLFYKISLIKNGLFSEALFASEIDKIIEKGTNLNDYFSILISHSGESVDIIKAGVFLRDHGSKIIGITDFSDSSLYKLSDLAINVRAGNERSIAATKSHFMQVLLGLGFLYKEKESFSNMAMNTSNIIKNIINSRKSKAADKIGNKVIFLGSDLFYPLALEASLKFKETSEIIAEGYPPREFLHGHIQILDGEWTVITMESLDPIIKEKVTQSGANFVDFSSEISKLCGENYKEIGTRVLSTLTYIQLMAMDKSISMGKDPDNPSKLTKVVK